MAGACEHPESRIIADILEGDCGDEQVQWCQTCGAYRRVLDGYGGKAFQMWRGPNVNAKALSIERKRAELEAWNSLARYKFMQFGYWAAIWVHLNRLCGDRMPNPWQSLVKMAREHRQ